MNPRPRPEEDPVGALHDAHVERIDSSPEFAALMHEVACALAVEDLTEEDARTGACQRIRDSE